jgi:hypothetical protein
MTNEYDIEYNAISRLFVLFIVNLIILLIGGMISIFYFNVNYVSFGIFCFLLLIETFCFIDIIIYNAFRNENMIDRTKSVGEGKIGER